MKDIKWDISPGAVLVFALFYFFDSSGLVAALLPAVLVHEAGHAFVLHLGGVQLRRLSVGLLGLEMDYWGRLDGLFGAVAIAAGPLLGAVYALLTAFTRSEFLQLSGSASLLLSAFNLLPVLPLDGGRLVALAIGERALPISRVISLVFAAAGLYLWLTRGWVSVFAMGLWLAWWNFRSVCK